jgi:IrrE N-terminal-like domain
LGVDSHLLDEAVNCAENVYLNYSDIFKEPLRYRCDIIFVNIAEREDIHIESHPFSGDMCGMLFIDSFEKTIVYNSNQPLPRRNFTLGHELGHYFMHRTKESQFADRTKEILGNSLKNFEVQANIFAAQLLLPRDVLCLMLNQRYSFYRISKVTNISKESLYWRLVTHLNREFELTTRESKLFIDEFKQLSLAKINNIAHHGNSLLFSLNRSNKKRLVERLEKGQTNVDKEYLKRKSIEAQSTIKKITSILSQSDFLDF